MSACATCTAEQDLAPVAGDDDPAKLYCPPCLHHRKAAISAEMVTVAAGQPAGEWDRLLVYAEMRVREQMARELAATAGPPPPSLKSRLLDAKALKKQPMPRPLIRDVLELESEAWLIGPPKEFKSFVALDWALHVATGVAWRGCAVHQGPVLYVAAEGSKGIRKRVAAWEIKHGITDPEGFYVLPAPVQAKGQAERWVDPMLSAEWRELVALAKEIGAVMVVLDTQARMTIGLEENSNSAMSLWTEAVRVLKEATGAAVLVVHHTGKDKTSARGASALNGAQDHEWRVARVGGEKSLSIDIIQTENKDGADDGRYSVDLEEVDLGVLDDMGRAVTSLVLAGDVDRSAGTRRGAVAAGERLDIESAALTTRQWIVQILLRLDIEGQGALKSKVLETIRKQQEIDGIPPGDRLNDGTFNTTIARMLKEPEGKRTLFQVGANRITLTDPAAGSLAGM